MNSETKNTSTSSVQVCQNCKQDFKIQLEDFAFYQKIKVPPPTLCSFCRQLYRYAWRNERTLYRRNCDLCSKNIVTIYSPDKPFKVYCLTCWWGDGWDPSEYGKDFDFSRGFFEQFSEMQHQVPRMALLNKNSVNSEYTNHSADNKNVYLSFSCFGDEDVAYSTWVMYSKNCMDSSYVYEKGERLYECIDSRKSYQCQYSMLLRDCSNCLYCYDCHGSSDCFMSSNLRNRRYVFRNQQLTREVYLEAVKNLNLTSLKTRDDLSLEFKSMLEQQAFHKYFTGERNVHSTGNMIFGTKNALMCFDSDKVEDSKYIFSTMDIKDSMDLYHIGVNVSLCYNLHGCTRVYDCRFCHLCYDDSSLEYCDSCQNSQNLFGCVSIKKGEYMIFNKKYSKAEYLELKNKIIEHMKTIGEYGEFFPPQYAPVSYNETQGQIYMPLTKEEVLEKGWRWEDKVPGTFSKETIAPQDIPDDINDVPDEIIKNIFKCVSCTKNYNVTANELLFYKREGIPLPRKCPECRYKRRFSLRPPRNLWHRQCMCNLENHEHTGECPNEFETSYAPGRPEKVYCEGCYQKEVL